MKDIIQSISWIVASFGGLIAAFIAIIQMIKNRDHAKNELRWKQALQAKNLIDEMKSNAYTSNALQMLDWLYAKQKKYIINNETFEICENDIKNALGNEKDHNFSSKEMYIRECFDHLFDKLSEIYHYIDIKLINYEDIKASLEFYFDRLSIFRKEVEFFLNYYSYDYIYVKKLLNSFSAWQSTKK